MASAELLRAAEHDAQKVLNRFFQCLDDGRYEALSALMAQDGVWHRQGKALKGPAGVLEAMRARPAGLATRHLVSNLVVDAATEDRADAVFYVTVYAHTGSATPAPVELPLQIVVFRQSMTRTAEGWRIAELSSTPAFRR